MNDLNNIVYVINIDYVSIEQQRVTQTKILSKLYFQNIMFRTNQNTKYK